VFLERLPEFAQNNIVLVMILVALVVWLIAHEWARFTRKYKALTPAQLTLLINRENALVVDISPHADYERGHILGAKSVLMSQFGPEHREVAKAKEQPIAIVCRSGQTAAIAAEKLTKAGFANVNVLEGGMMAWTQAELPVVRGSK
jgi:rhodanese-related sulfurtransferase